MSISKENLNNFLPNGFETENKEDYKMPFDEDLVQTGYERDVPDIVSGPNLNNLIDIVGKNTNTLNKYVNYLNEMPINSIPITDLNNNLNYIDNNFLNKSQITNCILEAPNGVATYTSTSITVKQGLKVLLPNGRNADGTLNNTEYTVDKDITMNYSDIMTVGNTSQRMIIFSPLSNTEKCLYGSEIRYFYIQTKKPTTPFGWWYNPITNYCYFYENSINDWVVSDRPYIIFGYNENNGSTFTYFRPLTTVQLADTNLTYITDTGKAYIAELGMPSDTYVDLNLGASGSIYTAPANGYFTLFCAATQTASWIDMTNISNGLKSHIVTSVDGWGCGMFLPVKRDQQISLTYDNKRINYFKFIYTEGEVK